MAESERESLGRWIRASRKRSRWTQGELGRLLGVTQATVSQWERGKSTPDDADLRELESVFGGAPQQLEIAPASAATTDAPAPAVRPAKKPRRSKSAAAAADEITEPATPYDAGRPRHAELLRQLWEAAVHLRGSIEPADYKSYVLPIIFLRFLSVRYEQRRARLADEVREPASPYFAETEEEAAFVLEDEDSYRSANVFPLINLFSRDVFSADHGGADMLGQVYEYFIGELRTRRASAAASTSPRYRSYARWWRCWSRSAGWCSIPAAARAGCSCKRMTPRILWSPCPQI